jgi:hypothetical protein
LTEDNDDKSVGIVGIGVGAGNTVRKREVEIASATQALSLAIDEWRAQIVEPTKRLFPAAQRLSELTQTKGVGGVTARHGTAHALLSAIENVREKASPESLVLLMDALDRFEGRVVEEGD